MGKAKMETGKCESGLAVSWPITLDLGMWKQPIDQPQRTAIRVPVLRKCDFDSHFD